MKDLRVGFDIDGVLANFIEMMYRKLHDETGIKYDPKRQYKFTEHLDYNGDFPGRIERLIQNEIKRDPMMWRFLQAYDQSEIAQVASLSREIPTYFVSTRLGDLSRSGVRRSVLFQTFDWLVIQGIQPMGVILTDKKSDAITNIGLDFFLEDRWKNCDAINSWTNCKCFLLDRPYNRVFDDNGDRVRLQEQVPNRRVKAVSEFISLIHDERNAREFDKEGAKGS